jgi:hypothetical protein
MNNMEELLNSLPITITSAPDSKWMLNSDTVEFELKIQVKPYFINIEYSYELNHLRYILFTVKESFYRRTISKSIKTAIERALKTIREEGY